LIYYKQQTESTKGIHSSKNKKSGLDISPYLLKICVPYIIKPPLELVSASNREGMFPSTLKKSVVKPVYKKCLKEDANNYFLITLVPALSRILEKVLANQLISYLDKHSYLINLGLNFKSTNDAVATIIKTIIEN
jgi:hypothetical protein